MLEETIRFLIDPFHMLLFLIVVCGLLYTLKKIKWAKRFVWLSLFWFLIISTPFFPTLLIHSLESRYLPLHPERIDASDNEYHIIVLGAGYSFDDQYPPNTLLNRTTLGRLIEGIRIQKHLPGSKLVTSGPHNRSEISQAEVAKSTAIMLGVRSEDIFTQDKPTNTFEEAREYFKNFYGKNKVILVTSSTHMHRALLVFKYFGIEAIASPTNYQMIGQNSFQIFGFPSTRNIDLMRNGISEYAAITREVLRLKWMGDIYHAD